MNPNSFSRIPFQDSFVSRPEGCSPMSGMYRSPNSPFYRSQMMPRHPVFRPSSGHPYSWTPRASTSADVVEFANANFSPRYRSPFDSASGKSAPSTPFQSQNGGFRPRSSGRFSGNGRQSWSSTPTAMPGNTWGTKRMSSGSSKYESCNPGGCSNIRLYYNPSMLSDPWAGLKPVSLNQVTMNTTPCRH